METWGKEGYAFAGLGAVLGLMQALLLSPGAFGALGLVRPPNDEFDIAMLMAFSVSCCIAAAIDNRVSQERPPRRAVLSAVVLEGGLALLCCYPFVRTAWLMAAAGFLCGVGSALSVLSWLALLADERMCGMRALCTGVSFLAMFVVCYCVAALPSQCAMCVALAVGPVSGMLMMRFLRFSGYSLPCYVQAFSKREGQLPKCKRSHLIGGYASSLLCLLAFAVVFGAIGQIAIGNPEGFGRAGAATIISMGIAAILFFCAVSVFANIVSLLRVFEVMLPVLLGVLFLLPFLGEENRVVVNGFVAGGYFFMSFAFMLLVANMIAKNRLSSFRFNGFSRAVETAGCLTGVVVGNLLAFDASFGFAQTVAVVFVSGYLLCLAFLVLSRREGHSKKVVVVRKVSQSADEQLLKQCEECARSYFLTKREKEILFYIVKGRSRTYISDELFVSPNTVKGHIKNIYTKTGIHSKQQLIDLVEE